MLFILPGYFYCDDSFSLFRNQCERMGGITFPETKNTLLLINGCLEDVWKPIFKCFLLLVPYTGNTWEVYLANHWSLTCQTRSFNWLVNSFSPGNDKLYATQIVSVKHPSRSKITYKIETNPFEQCSNHSDIQWIQWLWVALRETSWWLTTYDNPLRIYYTQVATETTAAHLMKNAHLTNAQLLITTLLVFATIHPRFFRRCVVPSLTKKPNPKSADSWMYPSQRTPYAKFL